MFGGGTVTAWTIAQLQGLARQKVLECIAAGQGDGAKELTRELMRLCVARAETE